jgi:hypothetical protein
VIFNGPFPICKAKDRSEQKHEAKTIESVSYITAVHIELQDKIGVRWLELTDRDRSCNECSTRERDLAAVRAYEAVVEWRA